MTRTYLARIGTTIVALALALTAATGCSAPSAEKPAAPAPVAEKPAFPVTITDDTSRTVTIAAEPQRIVSLAPGNTEMLFAIGAGDRVVGVTTYDDYPAEVTKIAKVGDFAGPNLEAVAAAKPDLVVATTGVQADIVTKLEALGATVIAVDPTSLDALYADINELGQATGETAGAAKVVEDMKTEVAKIEARVSGAEPVTAFVEIGQNPLFTVGSGTLIDELVTVAGGKNIVTQPGYVPFSVEELVKANPAVYMATKGSMSDPTELKKRAGYSDIAAVRDSRVIILDDNYVSRPGPRVVLGLKQIAEGLYPEGK